jgi:glycosyltransferase involved in cell wall biosynthesis
VSQIRLCFFCSLSTFDTGMPISTFKLIEHFSRSPDFSVHVILPAQGELARRVRLCGIEPWIIPFSRLRSWRRPKEFARFLISFPVSFLRICRVLGKNRIELVHFSDIIDLPFYACGFFSRAVVVAHLRHCIESAAARVLFRAATRLFVRRTICISEAVRRFSGLGRSRSRVVYNPGPDPALFDPARRLPAAPGLPDGGKIVLTIGKFLRVKGHEHFVDLARRVESARPGLCRFVILGSKFPAHEGYFAWVRGLIEKFGLSRSIVVIDQVSHESVPAILSRASVYAHLPNWQEGFGGAIVEAMAMQVPVVAFDCGGVAECFTSGASGFLVGRLDTETAAGHVIRLLEDDGLRRQMGLSARKEAIEKFSYQKHFSEIERIYVSLLAANRAVDRNF